jgi:ABC-2 type transport system permease protein
MRILADAPPLLDFATGRTGLDPIVGEAAPSTPLHRVFDNYQVDNPQSLALVRFDFAFVASVIAPLILIVLCAGLLADDHGTGRFALLLAHGAKPARILLARIAARTLLTAVPLGGALSVQAILGGGVEGARGAAFAMFSLAAGLGLAFWAGLCVTLNSLDRAGIGGAAALFVAWLIITALGPSAITAGAQALSPAPARLAFLADARSAEIAAVKTAESLARDFLNDHPELERGGFDVPAWAKSRYVVSLAIDAATAPARAAFDASLQQQSDLTASLQALSPTLSQSLAMTDAAGTGVLAALAKQAEARTHIAALRGAMGQAIMGGRGIDTAQAQSWTIRTLSAPAIPASPLAVSFAWLALWVALVWAAAVWALNQTQADRTRSAWTMFR